MVISSFTLKLQKSCGRYLYPQQFSDSSEEMSTNKVGPELWAWAHFTLESVQGHSDLESTEQREISQPHQNYVCRVMETDLWKSSYNPSVLMLRSTPRGCGKHSSYFPTPRSGRNTCLQHLSQGRGAPKAQLRQSWTKDLTSLRAYPPHHSLVKPDNAMGHQTYHPSTSPSLTNHVSFLLDSTVLLRFKRLYSQMYGFLMPKASMIQ